ncbi:MAG: hypothetical protein PHG30_05310, partial [Eubacteriales bacterium]|nr:hypothetical protein [Eubacteriales bacterium]
YVGGGGFINQSQIAKYLRRSRDCIPPLVEDLDFLSTGREKKYFIPDIASRLLDHRNVHF